MTLRDDLILYQELLLDLLLKLETDESYPLEVFKLTSELIDAINQYLETEEND